jgi:hypothetical protein
MTGTEREKGRQRGPAEPDDSAADEAALETLAKRLLSTPHKPREAEKLGKPRKATKGKAAKA